MEELCRIMEDERAAVTDCMYGALADLTAGQDQEQEHEA